MKGEGSGKCRDMATVKEDLEDGKMTRDMLAHHPIDLD